MKYKTHLRESVILYLLNIQYQRYRKLLELMRSEWSNNLFVTFLSHILSKILEEVNYSRLFSVERKSRSRNYCVCVMEDFPGYIAVLHEWLSRYWGSTPAMSSTCSLISIITCQHNRYNEYDERVNNEHNTSRKNKQTSIIPQRRGNVIIITRTKYSGQGLWLS